MEHLRNIDLGPRHNVRLADLGKYDRFQAICMLCGHRAIIHPDLLRRRWAGDTRIVHLKTRLRCKGCGNTATNVLEVGRLKRD